MLLLILFPGLSMHLKLSSFHYYLLFLTTNSPLLTMDSPGGSNGKKPIDIEKEEKILSSKYDRANEWQKEVLEDAYEYIGNEPGAAVKATLANITQLPYDYINTWFDHRRFNERSSESLSLKEEGESSNGRRGNRSNRLQYQALQVENDSDLDLLEICDESSDESVKEFIEIDSD